MLKGGLTKQHRGRLVVPRFMARLFYFGAVLVAFLSLSEALHAAQQAAQPVKIEVILVFSNLSCW